MSQKLSELRGRIQQIDVETVRLLRERMETVRRIGVLKSELGLPVLDAEREQQVLNQVADLPHDPIPTPLLLDLFERILKVSRAVQSIALEKKT
jgi:chorismate mutase